MVVSIEASQSYGAGEKVSDGERRCQSLYHVQVRFHLQQYFMIELMLLLI